MRWIREACIPPKIELIVSFVFFWASQKNLEIHTFSSINLIFEVTHFFFNLHELKKLFLGAWSLGSIKSEWMRKNTKRYLCWINITGVYIIIFQMFTEAIGFS